MNCWILLRGTAALADDPDRPSNTSETILTEHLSDYLTGVARKSSGWDILQFRTEAVDEHRKARKIDLTPKPCGRSSGLIIVATHSTSP